MKRHKGVRPLVPLLLLLPLLCIQHAVLGIGIRPHRVDVVVSQGTAEVIEITLTNSAEETKSVDVSLVGVRSLQDGSLVWLSEDGTDGAGQLYPYASIGNHVMIEPSSFTMAPGSEHTLRLRVQAPEALEPGGMAGRVGALWLDVRDEREDDALFDSVIRFVAFVLIEFDGGQRRAADLTVLKACQEDSGDLSLPILLSNTGNTHLSPTGLATIRDSATGEIVEQIALSEGTLLPGCPREYTAVWKAASVRDGRFDVEFVLSCDGTLLAQGALPGIAVEHGVLVPVQP
ncbi:MAG: hypothetical protein WBC63_09995 [Candidatus Bipolaricaulia bacterium]